MDNLLTEEEIYNDCKNVFEEMFEGETISDLCYFKTGWVMKACKAVLQTQLSKLLSTVPDVREKVRKYLCPDSNTKGCGVKCPGYKNCTYAVNHIHALYAGAVLAAADEARREERDMIYKTSQKTPLYNGFGEVRAWYVSFEIGSEEIDSWQSLGGKA